MGRREPSAPGDRYFLGYSSTEQRRLQQQAEELAADSIRLFGQLPLGPGSRVVEVGCGPQGCLEILAERVGPTGSVVGVEVGSEAAALAQFFVSQRGFRNVEVRQADAKATGLPRGSFDLATARLVLVNVPGPEAIVAEMAALVKPGGIVVLHEADWAMTLCDPPLPAWDRMIQAFLAYARANAIDMLIGRRLASLLRAQGLEDVRIHPFFHVYDVSHGRRMLFPQFAGNLRERMLASAVMSAEEFDDCRASLERHLADPETTVLWAYFQAWATKPVGR